MTDLTQPLVVIELNEVNLELAAAYPPERFPTIRAMLASGVRRTSSESHYEKLEPWIQWVSAHTGLTADEHGVFRLGDIVGGQTPQYLEKLESRGIKVGAISPMNTENRLSAPAYFIPDPWTPTSADPSPWSRLLHAAISQTVNDNAQQKIAARSLIALLAAFLRFARPRNYLRYVNLAVTSLRAPWRRAMFLDLLLHDVHVGLFGGLRPGFSSLFLNAGAHIQHHYMFNAAPLRSGALENPDWYVGAELDPLAELLELYDGMLAEYLARKDVSIIVATGLTQKPYPRVEFYWRLKDHEAFLRELGVPFRSVNPLMTRDFVANFDDGVAAAEAERRLRAIVSADDGVPIFGEIDNRGQSLFITLTYGGDVSKGLDIVDAESGRRFDLRPHLVFVALKNGMHDSSGFAFYQGLIEAFAPRDGAHVKHLHDAVLAYFGHRSRAKTAA